jgi:hypothetical protein
MRTLFDILTYFLIAVMVVQNHLLIAFLLVLIFTFRRGAILLIPLAFAIDGYFGAFAAIPTITLCTIAWYAISAIVRPQLLMQYKAYGKTTG